MFGLSFVLINMFRFRWNNYKVCQRKAASGEEHQHGYFHEHFLSDDHNGMVEDCKICFIDKTDSSNPARRKYFLIARLRTISLEGLNFQENV